MSYRVFLDTNVIFAALYNKKGRPASLILHPKEGIELISSTYVKRELDKLLNRQYPSLENDVHLLSQVNFIELPEFKEDNSPIRDKDLPVLRAAQYLSCDYLVTGDLKDFSHLMRPSFSVTTKIVTVSTLLKILS